jgi:predicted Zn finger-like uncharacterized protein
MSLATRCTSCGTVFRVVQDQLKVSEGWVRCGQCSAVFNALDGLFDLGRGPGGSAEPEYGAPHVTAFEATTIEPSAEAEARDRDQPAPEAASDVETSPSLPSQPGTRDADTAQHIAEGEATPTPSAQEAQAEVAAPSQSSTLSQPEFVRHAERLSHAASPRRRAVLGSIVALLGAALVLQGVHHFRDSIAARWPSTRAALIEGCVALNCVLEAPRRIEDIAVESSSLTRSNAAPQAFRLAVSLRNRGATLLSAPSLDLNLTDANGQIVSRRILTAADFRVPPDALKPGAEASWQLLMSTGSEQVTGYTIEAFYP